MRSRNDASPVKELGSFVRFFPHLMKRRSDSLVFYKMEADVTAALDFIRKKKHDSRDEETVFRLFNILAAALVRTIELRPHLNRFISNYRYWQRNELSFNFIVKQGLTDKAPERTAIVKVLPGSSFNDISGCIQEAVGKAWNEDVSRDERAISLLLSFPVFITRIMVGFAGFLDRIGRMPQSLRDTDGLHVSAFIANLGSINLPEPPIHHLYEWGTTSIFMTIGRIKTEKSVNPDGEIYSKQTIQLGFTIDERIAEGFYLVQSMKLFRKLVENPEMIDSVLNKGDSDPDDQPSPGF